MRILMRIYSMSGRPASETVGSLGKQPKFWLPGVFEHPPCCEFFRCDLELEGTEGRRFIEPSM